MTVKARIPKKSTYLIPHTCVACGASTSVVRGSWSMRVEDSNENFISKITTHISLELPLCDDCHAVSGERRNISNLWLLLAIILFFGVWLLSDALVVNFTHIDSLGCVSSLAGVTGYIFLVKWLYDKVQTHGMNAEQKQRRKRVNGCVKLSAFNVEGDYLLRFKNAAFASEFTSLNGGVIV